jgi:hypothetical protein
MGAESFEPSVNPTGFNDHGALEANGACTQKISSGSQISATRWKPRGGSFT